MGNPIRQAVSVYGTVRLAIARAFLVVIVAFFLLFTLVTSWLFVSLLWNDRVLTSAGVEVDAELIARRGIPVSATRGPIREPDPIFTVTWTDTQGQRRTSPIKFSSRFAQEIVAKRAKTVRIRYVPTDPSIIPVAVEDGDLITDHAWYPLFGILGTVLSLLLLKALRRRKSLGEHQEDAIQQLEAAEPEISVAEWKALHASPSDDLLRKLYSRPHARYRIADTLGAGPARTFEAFREQVARLSKA
jgi:hypothetical protein